MIRLAVATTMPTHDADGRSPVTRSVTACHATYAASAKKLIAMSFVARRSAGCLHPVRFSWARRQVIISAPVTSMTLSSPKPMRLMDAAEIPAARATTASTTLYPIVIRLRRIARVTA